MTITIVIPFAFKSLNLAKHLAWKFASPTANISSINKTSASTLIATENAKRIYIPEEYVRTGLSINCSSSLNVIISSRRSSISFLDNPKIDAFVYILSLPDISG